MTSKQQISLISYLLSYTIEQSTGTKTVIYFFYLEMDHSFSSIEFRTVLYFKTKYGYKDSDFFFFF